MGDQVGPGRKAGQGQPTVIIYMNFVELGSSVFHFKLQEPLNSGFEEENV